MISSHTSRHCTIAGSAPAPFSSASTLENNRLRHLANRSVDKLGMASCGRPSPTPHPSADRTHPAPTRPQINCGQTPAASNWSDTPISSQLLAASQTHVLTPNEASTALCGLKQKHLALPLVVVQTETPGGHQETTSLTRVIHQLNALRTVHNLSRARLAGIKENLARTCNLQPNTVDTAECPLELLGPRPLTFLQEPRKHLCPCCESSSIQRRNALVVPPEPVPKH